MQLCVIISLSKVAANPSLFVGSRRRKELLLQRLASAQKELKGGLTDKMSVAVVRLYGPFDTDLPRWAHRVIIASR